ncbi:hypothetical protein [Anaeromicrobium sediminis]|uniref:hypothetical protein n=1 Tax=Anaeromicrobium sediminis TaxID=1478221 RepID=UPI001595DDAA|nr:hypothetical protein [Anaeromicrobium sediminis]
MCDELNDIETELKMFCIKLISMFDELKEKGLLSEEEYLKHVILKKKFLEGKL